VFLNKVVPKVVFPGLWKAFVGTLFGVVLLCLLQFFLWFTRRLLGTEYEISEKALTRKNIDGIRAIRWKDVTGYSVFEDRQFAGAVSIRVHAKTRNITLWVPRGELLEQVKATFTQRCGCTRDSQDEASTEIVVTEAQYLWLLVFTLAYSIGVGYLAHSWVHSRKSALPIAFAILGTLVFGPGTLGCIAIYGIKSFRQKDVRGYALIFNFLAAMFLGLFLVLLEIYHWSRIIKELE
jgi:hypothetical protein